MNISGTAGNITTAENMRASIKLDAKTYDLGFVNELLKAQGAPVTIPGNITLKGDIGINGNRYTADLTATEGGGKVKAEGRLQRKDLKL